MTAPRQLSWNERTILAALTRAADAGATCPKNEDLDELIHCSSSSAASAIVKRLENWGLIRVERWQKERRVTIVETGKSTAEVRNKAVHWRHRPATIPSPAALRVRKRDPEVFLDMERAAKAERRDMSDFLGDLVWMGWEVYRDDRGTL